MMAGIEEAYARWRAVDNLKVVSVKMEWMLAWVVIVEYNFHDVALLQHVAVGVVAIDSLV